MILDSFNTVTVAVTPQSVLWKYIHINKTFKCDCIYSIENTDLEIVFLGEVFA